MQECCSPPDDNGEQLVFMENCCSLPDDCGKKLVCMKCCSRPGDNREQLSFPHTLLQCKWGKWPHVCKDSLSLCGVLLFFVCLSFQLASCVICEWQSIRCATTRHAYMAYTACALRVSVVSASAIEKSKYCMLLILSCETSRA